MNLLNQNIFCTITFHYRPQRLRFLTKVLHSLASFMCNRIDVTIVINHEASVFQDYLSLILKEFSSERFSWKIYISPPLSNPWHLTWAHKQLHVDAFNLRDPSYDVFMYFEDDIGFTWANFTYWCRSLPELKKYGLMPGFFRVEQNQAGQWRLADSTTSVNLQSEKILTLPDGQSYLSLREPYQAFWILDRELMKEYLDSPSFDLEASAKIIPWGDAERAAMGLTFENVPEGFISRSVVPLERNCQRLDWCASVHHLPNTYASEKKFVLGKIPVSEFIRFDSDLNSIMHLYQDAFKLPQKQSPWMYEKLGDLLRENGQEQASISFYKKAIRSEPDNAYCHLQLAKIYDGKGEFNQAISHYKKVLSICPWDNLSKQALAQIEVKLGRKIEYSLLKDRIKAWLKFCFKRI
jgi:tetratricopeptide (TPR) repeat protein